TGASPSSKPTPTRRVSTNARASGPTTGRCSAKSPPNGSAGRGGGHHPGDGVADEAGLLAALELEREAGDDLVPAAANLLDGDDLDAAANPRVDRHRGRETDLVPAVVDAKGDASRSDQFFAEAVDQREGPVPVSDRRPERALLLGPLDVDVDPLIVAGELGEGVDIGLGDRAPLAR